MSDPGPTRREGGAPPGVRPTRRDREPAEETFHSGLPPELAVRFTVVESFLALGSEADLFLVEDLETSRHVVLKLYRHGITVDEGVGRRLLDLSPNLPHCVTVYEAGTASGRDYEIQEYAGRDRVRIGEEWTSEQIADLVRQIAGTLHSLHEVQIVHRDLKPDNLIVRETDPLNFVLCDFGVSRSLDMTVVFTSVAGTLAYLPPEALVGPEVRLSRAWDWWSLGMVVRAMATRREPDAGLAEQVYRAKIATRPVDLTGVADERLRLLCRGLLVRDPERRWGSAQVFEWLNGGSPEVRAESESARDERPSEDWTRRTFADAAACAAAIAADWDGALAHLCGSAPRDHASELRRLVPVPNPDWLDPAATLLAERAVSAPVRLLRLMRLLDPDRPPSIGGFRIDGDEAIRLARIAVDQTHPEHGTALEVVDLLRDPLVLRELTGMPGGHRLRVTAHNWRHLAARRDDADPWLLYFAADPDGATETLRGRLNADARLRGVDWFAKLAYSPDPIDLLTALHRYGDAERDARLPV